MLQLSWLWIHTYKYLSVCVSWIDLLELLIFVSLFHHFSLWFFFLGLTVFAGTLDLSHFPANALGIRIFSPKWMFRDKCNFAQTLMCLCLCLALSPRRIATKAYICIIERSVGFMTWAAIFLALYLKTHDKINSSRFHVLNVRSHFGSHFTQKPVNLFVSTL